MGAVAVGGRAVSVQIERSTFSTNRITTHEDQNICGRSPRARDDHLRIGFRRWRCRLRNPAHRGQHQEWRFYDRNEITFKKAYTRLNRIGLMLRLRVRN